MDEENVLPIFPSTFVTSAVNVGFAFVKFTPISGCNQDDAALCYLLEVDNTRILLDCGADPLNFGVEHLKPLDHIEKIDAILLSHFGIEHCGGLLTLKDESVPIYATTPIHQLAPLALYETAQNYSRQRGSLPSHLDPHRVEKLFAERVKAVKYSQPLALSGGLIVMAAPCGHSPGGTIWRIRKNGEDIVYAMRINHRRELTMDGATLDLTSRPSLAIIDSLPALKVAQSRNDRDRVLADIIQNVARQNGTMFIPCNFSRALEVLYAVSTVIGTRPIHIGMVGFQSSAFVESWRGMLEWMGVGMMRAFEATRSNPFRFDNVSFISNTIDLEKFLAVNNAKVVISLSSYLLDNASFATEILSKVIGEKGNMILLPEETNRPESLSYQMLHSSSLVFPKWEMELLEGDDLRRWKLNKREQEQQAAAEAAFAALKQKRSTITDELAEFQQEDEEEEDDKGGIEEEEEKKEDKSLLEEIDSAAMLKEIFWTDYRNEWILDLSKDEWMRRWVEDREYASLTMLGGTGGCRFQAFPVASGIVSSNNKRKSLIPSRIVNSAYGIVLDYSTLNDSLVKSSKTNSTNIAAAPSSTNAYSSNMSKAPVIRFDERPHRMIGSKTSLGIKCQKRSVDFSGLIDGRSLKTVLGQMMPRRVIIVGSASPSTDYLYNHLVLSSSSLNVSESIIAPSSLLQCVNLSQSQQLLLGVISDELAMQCRVVQFKGFELGKVQFSSNMKAEKLVLDHAVNGTRGPSDSTCANNSRRQEGSRLVMVGDLKLAQLRKALQERLDGLGVDFVAGDLVVSVNKKQIALIRKNDESSVLVEGEACPEYFEIRKLIYSQLAMIN